MFILVTVLDPEMWPKLRIYERTFLVTGGTQIVARSVWQLSDGSVIRLWASAFKVTTNSRDISLLVMLERICQFLEGEGLELKCRKRSVALEDHSS